MNGIVSRFTTFDKLIATALIKVLYWIGIIFIVLGTLIGMFSGFGDGFISGVSLLVVSPILGIIGLIFWRFLCEVYIVIFGIYDRLGDIKDGLAKG